jgi:hypothetical protein
VADGALQAVAEGVPPWWGLPAIGHSKQLFFWFFAVIVIALAVPAIAFVLRRRDPDDPAVTVLVVGGLFGLGILPQAMQRPDSTHLAWVAVVSWSLLVPALVSLGAGRWSLGRRAIGATVAVGLLMAVVCPFYTYRHYLLHTRVSAGELPVPFLVERGDHRFWFGDFFVAEALNEMIPELEARSEPGDRLIVGPADLSRTIYSDVSVYFLFPELVPATYYIEMDPGRCRGIGAGRRHRDRRLPRPDEHLDRLERTERLRPAPVARGQSGGRRPLLPGRTVRGQPGAAVRALRGWRRGQPRRRDRPLPGRRQRGRPVIERPVQIRFASVGSQPSGRRRKIGRGTWRRIMNT